MASMESRSLPSRAASTSMALAIAIVFLIYTAARLGDAASVEHTFIVSQVKMSRLCKEVLVTVVNGQLPGPTIEITEGDSVTVHVLNRSPYNMTIHWHGIKQFRNCWADGVPMITQYPILPNKNFTYQFNVVGQQGTLWWHAHVPGLRATVHGAFIIRPRHGAESYPFPKPDKEVSVIIGDWWEKDLSEMAMNMTKSIFLSYASASTVNGLVGDLFNCSGVAKEDYVLDVEPGKTYLLRIINAGLFSMFWHGIKQFRNCWADGVPMITQYPILPNKNFTYQFNVVGQQGTLWWHAHVPGLRATVHGAFIIRPRHGAESYPFPKPDKEVSVIIGDWWEKDLSEMAMNMTKSIFLSYASASTVNGLVGDLFNCSGVAKEGYVLDVEPGKTYLLRIINAGLFSEFYLKIAGHQFTVVAANANYITPFTTDVIAISAGETVDALLVANAFPGQYYMVALPNQAPLPDTQTPEYTTRGIVQYKVSHSTCTNTTAVSSCQGTQEEQQQGGYLSDDAPMVPKMPDVHDTITSFYFHSNLTSLHHQGQLRPVKQQVDEHLFIVLGLGTICKRGNICTRGNSNETILVATMNNVSFHHPEVSPLLEAHYYHTGLINRTTQELPKGPPLLYNFTDEALIPFGPKEMKLEPTYKASLVRRFRHGAVVEIVFQSTAVLQGDSNPMHLHGHDMIVLAQGLGNFDPSKDMATYNLVNPAVKNTVLVPNLGWIAIRFVANNPGVWFMHCHYEFHLSMGMAAVFIVEDGQTNETSLPPPPVNFPTIGEDINLMPNDFYLETMKS